MTETSVKKETTIISKLDENEIRNWIDPLKLRMAYDWLTIEKEMKGQKWFIKDFLDRGKVINRDEKGGRFYAFESMVQITFDVDEAIHSSLSSEIIPYYIKVLKGEIPDSIGIGVPPIIIRLWEELNG